MIALTYRRPYGWAYPKGLAGVPQRKRLLRLLNEHWGDESAERKRWAPAADLPGLFPRCDFDIYRSDDGRWQVIVLNWLAADDEAVATRSRWRKTLRGAIGEVRR